MTRFAKVAVVGGGPAGLQAALTLGRMHVDTVVFDDGRARNSTSARMHNVLGWDGTDPARLRAAARNELQRYPWVRVVDDAVRGARRETDIELDTADGPWHAENLLIAAGVEDALLPIPGITELWGDLVLPCPYCHGHEHAEGPIAVISSGAHATHVGALLLGLTDEVPHFEPGEVASVARVNDRALITRHDGRASEVAAVFIPPNPRPRSSVAADLGVHVEADGIVVDALGRTNKPGVWAAGDVARRLDPRIPAAVVTAMASGLTAAADIAATVAPPPRER
ncbi:NAD(P)/FAD-dependent oxidoreductase [Microbacterium sp. KSW2-29]|uniref:NAD(P)/FAD-dependent oxidoreductase n=1 Tax=Microbacterium phycohabitans TaxID=3075993 RepID=A0ABU3SPY1_9MICO|nr:NAD(P)/FAD-dependent oxidoreductase [Microbacterium sp. KSW2-29]MDU0346899.1 NAD(P)/FAD-dependent oxidoreductase [Microbacterium sp. KSW2-29]